MTAVADVASVLFVLTTVIAIGLLTRLACQALVMRRRLADLDPAPSALQASVNRLAGHASIDVRVSTRGEGPFAVGLLRTLVVLPGALDATATRMVALLKYGVGVPSYRLERLQADVQIPLPASTQWEMVAEAAATAASQSNATRALRRLAGRTRRSRGTRHQAVA